MIVVWRITQRCNLCCPFCAYDRRGSWQRHDADVETIRRFGVVLAVLRGLPKHPGVLLPRPTTQEWGED